MEGISDEVLEVARNLFNGGDIDYNIDRYGKATVNTEELPDLDNYEYAYGTTRAEILQQAIDLIVKILPDVTFYNDYNGTGIYLELNDNHTFWDINGPDNFDGEFDYDLYNFFVEQAFDKFEAQTGVELHQCGRSGRHICVDVNFDNIINYDKLCQIQAELEQLVIGEAESNCFGQAVEEAKELAPDERATKCLSCGMKIIYKNRDVQHDAMGDYIECPNCHATFDVDYDNTPSIKTEEKSDAEIVNTISNYLEDNQLYAEVDKVGSVIILNIQWGDWKHDHMNADRLMQNIGYKLDEEEVIEENGSDCYSAIRYYVYTGSGKDTKTESVEPEEDKQLDFEERVNQAYLNCGQLGDFPTISNIIDYLDMNFEDSVELRNKIGDILYKLGYDWELEESKKVESPTDDEVHSFIGQMDKYMNSKGTDMDALKGIETTANTLAQHRPEFADMRYGDIYRTLSKEYKLESKLTEAQLDSLNKLTESKNTVLDKLNELNVSSFVDLKDEVEKLYDKEIIDDDQYDNFINIIDEQENKCEDYLRRRSKATTTDWKDELYIEGDYVVNTLQMLIAGVDDKEIINESSNSIDKAKALLDLFNEIYDGLGDMYAADEWAEMLARDYGISNEGIEADEVILTALNTMDDNSFRNEVDNLINDLFENNSLDYLKDTLHTYPRNLNHIIKCLNTLKPYASEPDKVDEAIAGLKSVNMNLRTTAEEFQEYLHDNYKPWTVLGSTTGPRTYVDLFTVPTEYDIVGADYFNYANRPSDMLDHIGYGWKQDGNNIVADLIGFTHSVSGSAAVYDQAPVKYGYSAVIDSSNKEEKFKEMAKVLISKAKEIKDEYGLGKKTEAEDMTQVKDEIETAVEKSDSTDLEKDQVKGSIDVLKTDEESAIEGYEDFNKETDKVVDKDLADAIDNQMQEIVDDEKEHIKKLDTIKSALDESKVIFDNTDIEVSDFVKNKFSDVLNYVESKLNIKLEHCMALEDVFAEYMYGAYYNDKQMVIDIGLIGIKKSSSKSIIEFWAYSTRCSIDYDTDGNPIDTRQKIADYVIIIENDVIIKDDITNRLNVFEKIKNILENSVPALGESKKVENKEYDFDMEVLDYLLSENIITKDEYNHMNDVDYWKDLYNKGFEKATEQGNKEMIELIANEMNRLANTVFLNEAKFKDKVKAIKKNLKQKDKRLSDETAQASAERIAGSMIKNEKMGKDADKKYSNLYKYKGKSFAYDRDNAIVEFVYVDPEDNSWIVLDEIGLSEDNWDNKSARDEYLDEYIAQLDDEANRLADDFLANEYLGESLAKRYIKKEDKSIDTADMNIDEIADYILNNKSQDEIKEFLDYDNLDNIDVKQAIIDVAEQMPDDELNYFLSESKSVKTEANEKIALDPEMIKILDKSLEGKLDFTNVDLDILKIVYKRLDDLIDNIYSTKSADDIDVKIKTILNKADITVASLPYVTTANEAFNLTQLIRSKVEEVLIDSFGADVLEETKQIKTEADEGTATLDAHTDLLPIINMYQYELYNMCDDLVPPPNTDMSKDVDEVMLDIAEPIIENEIKDVLPSAQITFKEYKHPQYYRAFSNLNDVLYFDITYNVAEYEALKEKALKDPEFEQYLQDHYTSYDGFMSFFANNISEFNDQEEWKQFVSVLSYYLPNDDEANYNTLLNDTYNKLLEMDYEHVEGIVDGLTDDITDKANNGEMTIDTETVTNYVKDLYGDVDQYDYILDGVLNGLSLSESKKVETKSKKQEEYEVWQKYYENGKTTTEYVQSFDDYEKAQKFVDGLNQDPNCEAWVKDLDELNEDMETATKQVGEYWVGDPCYVIPDDIYHGIWGDKYKFKDGIIDCGNGLSFQVHGTAWGDGEYEGSNGFIYGVDAGVLAIVPKELATKESGIDKGTLHKSTTAKLQYNDGVFHMIFDKETIDIDTDPSDDTLDENKKEEFLDNNSISIDTGDIASNNNIDLGGLEGLAGLVASEETKTSQDKIAEDKELLVEDDEIPVVNPDDKDYYDNKGYIISLYPRKWCKSSII